LARRARRIYLFRDEYIFDLQKAVVIETLRLGHATYVFAKPRNMDTFLAVYTKITKDDIRRNRDNFDKRVEGVIVEHAVHPAIALDDISIEIVAAEHDLKCARAADQARELSRRSAARDLPDADLGVAE